MGQQEYTSAVVTTFTVPVAVKQLSITLIGAGGGGASGSQGNGGGGGAYLDVVIPTSPGTSYGVQVGAGGSVDGDGSSSIFDTTNTGYIAGNGLGGNTTGAGGTVGGAYTADHTSAGGAGGGGCTTTCGLCDSCDCQDPPDCTSYSCSDSHSTSSCDAQGGGGSSGTASGFQNGLGGDCQNTGSDNCGYCTGTSCSGGNGGTAPTSPGGNGGNGGSNGQAPGGGGGGGGTGADGYLLVSWSNGSCVYTSQPPNTTVNTTINSFSVECRFSDGSLDTSFNGPVTIAIFNNPSGGTLSGTTTVNASSGVATFSDLSIDQVGTGYTLIVQDVGGFLNNGFSNSFDITGVARHYYTYLNKVAARLGNLVPKLAR